MEQPAKKSPLSASVYRDRSEPIVKSKPTLALNKQVPKSASLIILSRLHATIPTQTITRPHYAASVAWGQLTTN